MCNEKARDLLRSRELDVPELHGEIRKKALERGIAADNLLQALAQAPLALNGDSHRASRRALAAEIQPRVSEAVAAFTRLVDKQVRTVCAATETVDLFTTLLLPPVNAALAALGTNEIRPADYAIVSPPQIFSAHQMLSGARLQQLDQQIGRAPGDFPAAKVLALFAADPLMGSLGETLVHILGDNPGKPLCQIPWPPKLTRSAIPFAERVAAQDFAFEGAQIRKGQRVILYLGAFEDDGRLHFGAGPHSCLGKSLAEQLWAALSAALSARSERIEILSVTYREADFAFVTPTQIMSRIER